MNKLNRLMMMAGAIAGFGAIGEALREVESSAAEADASFSLMRQPPLCGAIHSLGHVPKPDTITRIGRKAARFRF